MLVRSVLAVLAVAAVALYGPSSSSVSVSADVDVGAISSAIASAPELRLSHAHLMNDTTDCPLPPGENTDTSCYYGTNVNTAETNGTWMYDCCSGTGTCVAGVSINKTKHSISPSHPSQNQLKCYTSYVFSYAFKSGQLTRTNCYGLVPHVKSVYDGTPATSAAWGTVGTPAVGQCSITLCTTTSTGAASDFLVESTNTPTYANAGYGCDSC